MRRNYLYDEYVRIREAKIFFILITSRLALTGEGLPKEELKFSRTATRGKSHDGLLDVFSGRTET